MVAERPKVERLDRGVKKEDVRARRPVQVSRPVLVTCVFRMSLFNLTCHLRGTTHCTPSLTFTTFT